MNQNSMGRVAQLEQFDEELYKVTGESDDKYLIAFENRAILYPVNTPPTKEAFYYRIIFESIYPNHGNVYKYWIPNTTWNNVSSDPSGLCQTTYKKNEQYDV